MSFLARAGKTNLIKLAEELGLRVESNYRVIDLKNLIVEDPNYDAEFTQDLLTALAQEKKDEEEKEERLRREKRELELERLRIIYNGPSPNHLRPACPQLEDKGFPERENHIGIEESTPEWLRPHINGDDLKDNDSEPQSKETSEIQQPIDTEAIVLPRAESKLKKVGLSTVPTQASVLDREVGQNYDIRGSRAASLCGDRGMDSEKMEMIGASVKNPTPRIERITHVRKKEIKKKGKFKSPRKGVRKRNYVDNHPRVSAKAEEKFTGSTHLKQRKDGSHRRRRKRKRIEGGYYNRMDYDWEPDERGDRSVVLKPWINDWDDPGESEYFGGSGGKKNRSGLSSPGHVTKLVT